MSLDQFMIWRFRNIEGVLANIKSWNMYECVFTNGSTINYNLNNDTVTIKSNYKLLPKTDTIAISACTKSKLINEFGFYERTDNRHSLSFDDAIANNI